MSWIAGLMFVLMLCSDVCIDMCCDDVRIDVDCRIHIRGVS